MDKLLSGLQPNFPLFVGLIKKKRKNPVLFVLSFDVITINLGLLLQPKSIITAVS